MHNNIGIIDSGIGGLTILKDLLSMVSDRDIYYISDEDNVPYGSKSQKFMFDRTFLMVESLMEVGVRSIVLACNTLTAETIDKLRVTFSQIEFFGIEPYINYLNKEHTQEKRNVGLILTCATAKSQRFVELRKRVDPNGLVKVYPLNNLAMIIESLKNISFNDIKDDIVKEVKPLQAEELDILILGCTHYPIIANFLESLLNVQCINPHKYLVKRIVDFLKLDTAEQCRDSFYYDPDLSGNWRKVDIKDFHFLFLNT